MRVHRRVAPLLVLVGIGRAHAEEPAASPAPADSPTPAASPAPANPPSSAASPVPTVALTGRVLEQGSGSGVPATLLVDGTAVEAGSDGRFTLDAPVGGVLEVHAAGYVSVSMPVAAPSVDARTGLPEPLRIYLRRGAGQGEVVVEARRDAPVVAEQHLDAERVNQTPGTFDDAMRLLQALPGVAQTPEYSPRSGDIAVRGSFPGDNHYYLDGIEIPYLFHYNNYASVLPTRALDELTLYPSTFAARFGDATGAVIDATSVWDEPDRVRASLNVSVIMAAAGVDVPLVRAAPEGQPARGTWTLRANARRSYVDLFSSSSLQYTAFPAFSDWFARVEHTDLHQRRWSVLGFGGADGYVRYAGEPTLLDPWQQSQNPEFTYGRQFQVAAVQHMGARATDNVRGSFSFTNSTVSGVLPVASAVQATRSLVLREDGELQVADPLWIAVGGEVAGSQDHIDVTTDAAWPEVARESELLARGVADHEDIYRLKGAVYAEPRWEPGPLRVQPGVRVAADSATARVAADPRLGLRLHPATDTFVRAASGIYTQFPTATQLSPVLGDPDLAPQRSYQIAGGVDQAVAGRWEFSLDGWSKWGQDVIVARTGAAPEGGHHTRAYGGSLSTRYRLRDVFFAWASLDLARSVVDEDGASVPTDYDQPFAVNVVASWTFLPTWNVGLRYRASAGMPYTPITDGQYLASSDTYAPIYGATNSARLPTYQKFDLHLEKRVELHTMTFTPYLEVWYVPPSGNVMYEAWSYDYDEMEDVHGPGFVPLMGVRGEL